MSTRTGRNMRVTVSQAAAANTSVRIALVAIKAKQDRAALGDQRSDVKRGVHRTDDPATGREIAPRNGLVAVSDQHGWRRRLRVKEFGRELRSGRYRARV